jgi:hypothetical protein
MKALPLILHYELSESKELGPLLCPLTLAKRRNKVQEALMGTWR